MNTFALSWQEIATAMRAPTPREKSACQPHRGRRLIPQETVRALRAEYATGGVSMADLARKYGISYNYAGKLIHEGIRDDELEAR